MDSRVNVCWDGTLVRYAFFAMVRVRYASKLELKYSTLVRYGLGPVYTVRTKLQNFLRSYVEGVYTIQNGAYERNGFTAYSVGGHDIVLNWITKITDLSQFFVVSVKFGSDYVSREVVLSFFSTFFTKKHNV